jgi:type I restriction enzyme S subunit
VTDGTHHSPPNGPTGRFRYVTAKDVKADGVSSRQATYVSREIHEAIVARCDPEPGDILYIKDGATTGVVTVNDVVASFSLLSSVALLKTGGLIDSWYACYAMRSSFFYGQTRGQMTGVGIPRVTLTKLNAAVLPVPPAAEQLRIVNRIRELLLLIDRLENATSSLDHLRNKARDSGLRLLRDSRIPHERKSAWKVISPRLDELFTRSADVGPIRQAIVDLATRGSLAPQEGKDESAHQLLHQISEERAKMAAAGLIRRVPAAETPGASYGPFELPRGWAWTDADHVMLSITDGDHLPPPKTETGIPFLVIGDVSRGRLNFESTRHVSPGYYEALDQSRRPAKGDLLYTVTGSFGIVVVVDTDRHFCVQRHIGILRPSSHVDPEYMRLAFTSEVALQYARERATGTAQKTVSLATLRAMPIPLPPQAEQRRIAAAVRALTRLLDDMEIALRSEEQIRTAVAKTFVHTVTA